MGWMKEKGMGMGGMVGRGRTTSSAHNAVSKCVISIKMLCQHDWTCHLEQRIASPIHHSKCKPPQQYTFITRHGAQCDTSQPKCNAHGCDESDAEKITQRSRYEASREGEEGLHGGDE